MAGRPQWEREADSGASDAAAVAYAVEGLTAQREEQQVLAAARGPDAMQQGGGRVSKRAARRLQETVPLLPVTTRAPPPEGVQVERAGGNAGSSAAQQCFAPLQRTPVLGGSGGGATLPEASGRAKRRSPINSGAMDDGNKRQAMQSAITRCYGCTTVSAAEAAGRACSLHGQTLVLAIDRQLNPDGVKGATAAALADERIVARLTDAGLTDQELEVLRTALHVFEAEHHVDPVSGRAGRADSLQAASPMPQRRTARATGAAPSAREGTAVATAHAPPAADTADAAGLSESLAHSRQMDSWEAHLAASDVTLRWIEGLMHPAAFPTLPILVLELRAASAQSMAGGRARRRGLFLPVAVTKAPEPQIVRNQSHFMYVEPEGDISLFFTWAEAHARASSDSHLRQGAIRLDSMLASWFQQRLRPHALFNTCFGSGPDASLWQHGALPLWLLKIFMSEMFVFKGTHGDDDGIWELTLPSWLLEPGHDVNMQAIMKGILEALKHLHDLRGFCMGASVYPALCKYTKQLVVNKYPIGMLKVA